MKADKVRELDTNELDRQVRDGQEQMFRLRFQLSMGQQEGLKKYKGLKKDRARMLTVLRERENDPEAKAAAEAQAQAIAAEQPKPKRRFWQRKEK